MPRPHPTSVVSASAAAHPHLGCAACPHEWGGHDPIGVRFCSTTVAAGLDRGCVCVDDVALFAPAGAPRR
jgi:hypothetical protein